MNNSYRAEFISALGSGGTLHAEGEFPLSLRAAQGLLFCFCLTEEK